MQQTDSQIVTRAPDETRRAGERLGKTLVPAALVLLTGPIGAGKSVLARGIGDALGVQAWSGSPTFTIVREYETEPPFYHVDLYRLDQDEVEELGLEEYVRPDAVVVVEWADRALPYLLDVACGEVIRLDVSVVDRERRAITIERYLSGGVLAEAVQGDSRAVGD